MDALAVLFFWDTAMYQGLKTTKQWCCCWLRSPTFLRGINQLGCAAAKSNSMRRKLNLFFFFFPQLHSIYLSVLLCTLFENHPKNLIRVFFSFYHFPSIFVLYKDPQCVVAILCNKTIFCYFQTLCLWLAIRLVKMFEHLLVQNANEHIKWNRS